VDLLAAAKLNDEAINEEQPVHGNKMSKKNKKKNKKQDLEDESEGSLYLVQLNY
jgi:ATP-binding cassette subfamily F protein 1